MIKRGNFSHVKTESLACPLPADLTDREALFLLVNTLESREPRLRGHGARTAYYALKLGHALHLSHEDLDYLRYAAYLHDVGKLSLPGEILKKTQPLTAKEYQQFQSHPRAAISLLDPWPFLQIPSIWIAHHHERWDGFGYPYGLKGELIPLGSRIIAVADMFDVLSIRSLNNADTFPEDAHSILRWYSGSHFDPKLVETFSNIFLERTSLNGAQDWDSIKSTMVQLSAGTSLFE